MDGKFDRVYSVGMFEHVGRASFATYFDKVYDATGRLKTNSLAGTLSCKEARTSTFPVLASVLKHRGCMVVRKWSVQDRFEQQVQE